MGTDVAPTPGTDDRGGIIGWSIVYPSRAGLRTVLIAGLLALASILILPWFVLMGYLVSIARSAATGEPRPADGFSDWTTFLVDGIVLVLLLVAAFVLLFLGSLPLMVLAVATDSIVPMLGVFVLWLGMAYLAPAAFVNFAVEGRARAAFDLGTIRTLASTWTYLVGWLGFVIVINGIGTLVFAVLALVSLLTIVGWIIIIPILYAYWYAIDAALWGRVYHRVMAA